MATKRRQFLSMMLGAAALGPLRIAGATSPGVYLGCRKDNNNRHFVTAIDSEGAIIFDAALPERGHGAAMRPGSVQCVVISRRPGSTMTVLDTDRGEVVHRIQAPRDRHYYGHGVFDAEGRMLYATENAFESGDGVIGIYDAADGYRRLGEIPSHGIGPHQLVLRRDGRTLAIANGGIRTHPDLGRSKLNLSDMDPNLAYVDSFDGRLLDAFRPPGSLHQLSIRHLDIAPDDTICMAAQYEGAANLYPPLVAIHGNASALHWLDAPSGIYRKMRNYCGSVCFDREGEYVAVSAPRGNRIVFWSLRQSRYVARTEVVDGCGVAAGMLPGEFVISSGQGGVFRYRLSDQRRAPLAQAEALDARWDNHMLRLSL